MEEVAEEKAQVQAMAGNWAEQLLYTDRWNPMSITEFKTRAEAVAYAKKMKYKCMNL